jgi:hypothetical protein
MTDKNYTHLYQAQSWVGWTGAIVAMVVETVRQGEHH